MYIHIFAHGHPFMCACTHVSMDTYTSVENMMKMLTFIIHVENDLVMHGSLQRMHSYIYFIMIAVTIIAALLMQKSIATYIYVSIQTHTFPLCYAS